MGREKRAAQNRAQESMEKSGRGSESMAGPVAAAPSGPVEQGHAHTSTRKAILQIITLYLLPILIIIVVGKLILRP